MLKSRSCQFAKEINSHQVTYQSRGKSHRDKGKITRTLRVTIILFAPFGKLDPHCVFRVHDPGLEVLHGTRAHFSLKDRQGRRPV